MALPHQHADRAAHRIANNRCSRHPQFTQDCCCVIRTVLELESFGWSKPTAMTTMVQHDEGVLLCKLFVSREEIDVASSRPAVQEKQSWRAWVGVKESANKELASSSNRNKFRWGQPRQLVVCVASLHEHFPHSPITSS